MTTYRVQHNRINPYVRLDKKFLESESLSAKAKGILAYLLSRPDDWKICIGQLVKVFADGEVAIRSGLKELKDAGYLVKAVIRDRTGRITGWRTDVYETPQASDKPLDKNGNVQHTPDVAKPEMGTPDVVHPDVDFPHLDNLALLNNEDLLTNDFTNPPLTPPREEREKIEVASETQKPEQPETTASLPDQSDCLEKEINPGEDQLSAAVPGNVKESKAAPRTYDPALGMTPPEERRTRQQRSFDWVPPGPWLVNGKLNPNFVDWQARDWIKAYGGDLHKKRADVLRHFKKDPANLAIAWEQYRSEQHHRYSNAALRMRNGVKIQPEEQQQLLAHKRAITEALPEEMNPVAVGQSGQWHGNKSQTALPANVVAFPSSEVVASNIASASPWERDQRQASFSSSPSPDNRNQTRPTTETFSLPTDSDGMTENSNAYKLWKPQPIEGEPVEPGEFRAKLAALTQELSMSKQGTRENGKISSQSPSNELEEFNQWLADPILKKEVMPRVMRSEKYTVEFDEQGEAVRVVEI